MEYGGSAPMAPGVVPLYSYDERNAFVSLVDPAADALTPPPPPEVGRCRLTLSNPH